MTTGIRRLAPRTLPQLLGCPGSLSNRLVRLDHARRPARKLTSHMRKGSTDANSPTPPSTTEAPRPTAVRGVLRGLPRQSTLARNTSVFLNGFQGREHLQVHVLMKSSLQLPAPYHSLAVPQTHEMAEMATTDRAPSALRGARLHLRCWRLAGTAPSPAVSAHGTSGPRGVLNRSHL